MSPPDLSKEEKLEVANKAREEVKQLLSEAKDGSVNGVRRRDCCEDERRLRAHQNLVRCTAKLLRIAVTPCRKTITELLGQRLSRPSRF